MKRCKECKKPVGLIAKRDHREPQYIKGGLNPGAYGLCVACYFRFKRV